VSPFAIWRKSQPCKPAPAQPKEINHAEAAALPLPLPGPASPAKSTRARDDRTIFGPACDRELHRHPLILVAQRQDLERDRDTHKAVERREAIAKGRGIDKSTIIARLREHEPELKAAGIIRLALFGSVARGEATAQSDVDLMGDFDRARGLTLFDMAGLEVRLGEILETRVDLSDSRMLKEPVRLRAEREAVLAF